MTALLEFVDVLIVCFVICATRLVLCSDIVVGVWVYDLLFIFISPLVHKYLCLACLCVKAVSIFLAKL